MLRLHQGHQHSGLPSRPSGRGCFMQDSLQKPEDFVRSQVRLGLMAKVVPGNLQGYFQCPDAG